MSALDGSYRWLDDDGPLPVIEGTLIRLQVDHLPGDRDRVRQMTVISALDGLRRALIAAAGVVA